VIKFKRHKILVTSALPYANGQIHIGHLVEYIQTDIFVRFLRLTGEDVLYVCADDAHGAPIEIKATELGITPEQLVQSIYEQHTKDFHDFGISFDNYYTTNSPENKHYSDLFYEKLKSKGFIYTKDIEVTYCENCKRTLPDRYVKGKCPKCKTPDQYGDVCESCNAAYKTVDLINPYCSICKNPPVRRKSNHYFFRLGKFSKELKNWLDENQNLQDEVKNFVYGWIKNGLEDWNISRDGPYFGFKIPGEENKFYYVWLDAPIGYIASTENYCRKHGLKTEDYWNSKDSRIYHFIGKDIVYFHFLFWPAMLMGTGFSLPHDIAVHGFLTVNGEKMSKSRGTFFTAREFLQKYEAEYLRFYYASLLGRSISDIDLSLDDFRKKVNNELASNIGNFCHRVLSFLNRNFDGHVNEVDENEAVTGEIETSIERIKKNYSELKFSEAVKETLHISSIGNKYFQDNEPWKMVKEDREEAHKVLGLCVNIAKDICILLSPIMPKFALELQSQLNLKELKWHELRKKITNHRIGKDKILVTKMEEESKKLIFPLNLKVAKIIDIREHPNAEKLLVLQLDLGNEKRQLVAGLKNHYTLDYLKGKNLIIISNLKFTKLRGIESQGMLLAGDDGVNVGILSADKSNPGEKVYFEGYENSTKELTYEEFSRIQMTVKDKKVFWNSLELKTDKETVHVEKVQDGAKVR